MTEYVEKRQIIQISINKGWRRKGLLTHIEIVVFQGK